MILTNLNTGLATADIVPVDAPKTHRYTQTLRLAWTIVRGQITSIFFILLLVSAVISFVLGEYTDAIILSVINIANVLLAFIQEFRASKAAEKLEAMVKTRVRVRRDGVVVQLEARQVVVGDIIEMITGDIFAVDVVARQVNIAQIDNSVRTGETLPVSVLEGQECLAGGVVMAGKIIGQVTAVGSKTSLAQYANRLDTVKKGSSFDIFITKISKSILIVALILLAIVAIFVVVIVPKLTLIQFLLFSIALLVGIVPESLPLIITIMLTREALALAKYNVIVKRLSALQELGAIDFLLTDKTGTLTQNNIVVSSFSRPDIGVVVAGVATAQYEREPMDTVFDNAISQYVPTAQASVVSRVESYNAERGYARYYLATGEQVVRGQIEKVKECCQAVELSEVEYIKTQENAGRRTLSYAIKSATGSQFIFLGSVSFEDPLKPDAADSIKKAELLGVDLKIITGDTRAVAESVALAVQVAKTSEQVMDARGIKMETLSPETLRTTEVYASTTPEQKLGLIDVYQKQGAVAFLGEGINDALALKRADVGIVVDNASDVARQSADILLLDKGLAPVLKGIEMGRKTYHHIATYLLCTLAGNAGTLISLVGVTLFWHDLPLLPVQILLNNLLTDVPLIFLISDMVSRQELLRPPDQAVRPLIRKIFLFGALSSVFDFVYFFLFASHSLEELRTGWFVFSVLSELVLVIALRTRLPLSQAPRMSGVLVSTLVGAAGLALALPFVPVVSTWFAFVPLPVSSLAILGGLVLIYIGANEVCKAIISGKSR